MIRISEKSFTDPETSHHAADTTCFATPTRSCLGWRSVPEHFHLYQTQNMMAERNYMDVFIRFAQRVLRWVRVDENSHFEQ